jgi:hypothetical protein
MKFGISRVRELVWLAVLASPVCLGAAVSERLFNAHYQIDTKDHDALGTIKSQFRLKADESIRFELLPNNIELSVHPVSDTEYDLHMIITSKRGDSPGKTRLDRVFRGRYGVPLELNSVAEQLRVGGAISVVPL